MSIQRILDKKVLCPLSNFVTKRGVIKPHMAILIQCEKGSLYAKCGPHGGRYFVSDHNTVSEIMEVCQVVQVTNPINRKERKKRDGSTQAR
jgi:hypothetical protein